MKKLFRNTLSGVIGGVCSGLEDFTNIDATIWRLLFIFGTIFLCGSILIYIIMWFIIPEK